MTPVRSTGCEHFSVAFPNGLPYTEAQATGRGGEMSTYPVLPWYREALLRQSLHVVSYASEEPISLSDAQQHLRLDLYGSPLGHPDDELLQQIYIPAAREYCETYSGRALAFQEYELRLRSFPVPEDGTRDDYIRIPITPVRSVNSVTYTDSDGVDQTLDQDVGYIFDQYVDEPRLYPVVSSVWPAVLDRAGSIRIRFTAGYDLTSASPYELPLPARYRHAMLLMLSHFYENRSQTEIGAAIPHAIEFGVQALLSPDALRRGFA